MLHGCPHNSPVHWGWIYLHFIDRKTEACRDNFLMAPERKSSNLGGSCIKVVEPRLRVLFFGGLPRKIISYDSTEEGLSHSGLPIRLSWKIHENSPSVEGPATHTQHTEFCQPGKISVAPFLCLDHFCLKFRFPELLCYFLLNPFLCVDQYQAMLTAGTLI